MNLSPKGLAVLTGFEGKRLVPYNDKATVSDPNPPSGNATVGYGHLLHRGPLDGTEVPITDAQSLSYLAEDVHADAEVYVNKIKAPLNQNQYDALCIFCYNVGVVDFEHVASECGLYTDSPNYSLVPEKILLYNKTRNQQGVLEPMLGLTRRRQAEASLFETPEAQ